MVFGCKTNFLISFSSFHIFVDPRPAVAVTCVLSFIFSTNQCYCVLLFIFLLLHSVHTLKGKMESFVHTVVNQSTLCSAACNKLECQKEVVVTY